MRTDYHNNYQNEILILYYVSWAGLLTA